MTIIISVLTGVVAGIFGGMFGIGGATIMVPAFIYFFKQSQHMAQGTAIAALLLPVGLFAALKYYQNGNVAVDIALYTAVGFLIGGFFGAAAVQPIPDIILRRAFAAYLIVIAVRLLF
jgi:hypothetical protein